MSTWKSECAGVVQWQNTTFPRLLREFDSPHPLHKLCRCSSMVERDLAKVDTAVQFRSSAPWSSKLRIAELFYFFHFADPRRSACVIPCALKERLTSCRFFIIPAVSVPARLAFYSMKIIFFNFHKLAKFSF